MEYNESDKFDECISFKNERLDDQEASCST